MRSPLGKLIQNWRAFTVFVKGIVAPTITSETLEYPPLPANNRRYKTNLIVTSLAIHILSLALPVMTLQIYDRILINHNVGTLYVLLSGVSVAIVFESILRLSRSYVVNWVNAAYEHAVVCNSMRHILHTDLSVIEVEGVGEQLQRMAQIRKLREFTSGQALITLIDLPFVGIYLVLISYLAGYLVLVPICLLLCFAFIAWQLGKKIKASLQNRESADEEKFGYIIESLTGIHTVKSLGLENRFQRNYEELQKQSSIGSYYVAKVGSLVASYGATFTQLMTVAVITFGAPMAMSGQLTLGSLIACILLSGRIINPLQKALGIWTRYQDFQLAKENVQETFKLPTIDYVHQESVGDKVGSVNIRDVSFSYNTEDPAVLRNVSLSLHRGDCISISGEHSCGKTTFLKLIAGLYKPSSGLVEVNDSVAYKIPCEDMIAHVGYLPMEGVIFKGSIRENLTGFGILSEASVKEVLALVGIESEIQKLPMGFDTPLDGVSADPIPPGLKQRIAIARVLASKPRIILFDDADRSLDKDGYHQIYRLLAKLKGKVTLVIVTDDRNIMQLADNEYVLDRGVLREKHGFDSSKTHDVQPYRELRL